jgi:hypothetical protein
VNGLQPLLFEETNNYIQHRLRVAGHRGGSLFSAAALARITEFTAGIPRNINNLCFNSLSLGCALQQKVIDAAIVEEVISDLDISRHTSKAVSGHGDLGPGASQVYDNSGSPVLEGAVRSNSGLDRDHLTPAEARAYMQQIVTQLQKSSQLVTEALSGRAKPVEPRNFRVKTP